MENLVCVADFAEEASKILDRNAWEYYKSGAEDENALADNKSAFHRWLIRPRVLRDVSIRSLSTVVLKEAVSFPLGISPSAMQKLAHSDGELAMVKAAEEMGTIYILSTNSTSSIEQVAAAAPAARKWFQLYVFKDRNISIEMVRKAEESGFEALVLTVDAPVFGRRRANIRNRFKLPTNLSLSNFPSAEMNKSESGSALNNFLDSLLDQSLTWEDFTWLKSMTKLPIIVKGIMSAEDAKIAVEKGANGIFVSNHGGRQLDAIRSSLDVLPEITKAVQGRSEVYLDGGVTTGADIFKALALGAKMCFIGRPALWGLSVAGKEGAKRVLQIYKDELDLTMSLAGVSDIKEITTEYVIRRSHI